jgi:hypothetical protein
MQEMNKSYNQRWKESGTTLTYKEWRKREDEKMSSFDGEKPVLSIEDTKLIQKIQSQADFQRDIDKGKLLGIPKYVFVVGGILLVTAIGFKIYKKMKK